MFKRYQRSEQALVLSMMEMVVNGVSTRKELDPMIEAWGTSSLQEDTFTHYFGLDLDRYDEGSEGSLFFGKLIPDRGKYTVAGPRIHRLKKSSFENSVEAFRIGNSFMMIPLIEEAPLKSTWG